MSAVLREKLNWGHPTILRKGHPLAQWLVFISISVTNILAVMSLWSVTLGGSSIAGALLLGKTELLWVSLSYLIVSSTCIPISDWLSKRYGYKCVFFIGSILFFSGTVASGSMASFWPMVIARSVAGLGSAGIFPNSITLLVKVFGEQKKTLVVALYVAMAFGVGTIAGLCLGGYLLEFVSWQSIFHCCSGFIPFVLLSILCFFAETDKEKKGNFDWLGMLFYLTFVGALIVWLADVKEPWNTDGFHSFFSKTTLAIVVVSLILFIWRENKCKNPLIDLSLFKIPTFLNGSIALFLVAMCFFSSVTGFSFIFENTMQYAKFQTGYYLLPIGIGMGLMGSLSSYLSSLVGPRIVYLTGMALVIFSCWINHDITIQSGHMQIGVMLLVRSCGIGLSLGPLTALVLQDVSESQLGQAAFMATLFRQMGGAIGSLVLSLVKELRTPFHMLRYGEQMGQNKQPLLYTANKLDTFFVEVSGKQPASEQVLSLHGTLNEASEASYRWLHDYVYDQAAIMATNDGYLLFGLALTLIAAVIIIRISKEKVKLLFKKK